MSHNTEIRIPVTPKALMELIPETAMLEITDKAVAQVAAALAEKASKEAANQVLAGAVCTHMRSDAMRTFVRELVVREMREVILQEMSTESARAIAALNERLNTALRHSMRDIVHGVMYDGFTDLLAARLPAALPAALAKLRTA